METSTSQPDEFFAVFSTFLLSMNDARVENERIRKQREEEEKRAQLEEKVTVGDPDLSLESFKHTEKLEQNALAKSFSVTVSFNI